MIFKSIKRFYKYMRNHTHIHIYEGNFKVTKDMIKNDKFIEGKIPKVIKGNFDCSCLTLTTLEGGPEEVSGNFDCSYNRLTNLEFCPKEINKNFDCYHNKLTSLEFGPKIVNGDFECSNNRLTSLELSPKNINGSFYCSYNNLTTLEGGPEKVNGDFYCSNNQLTSLEFGPKKVNGGFWCFNNVNDLNIEKEFILSGSFKNNYYTNILDYMLSNNINLEEVKTWPKGFITNNMKRSNKGTNIFNL